jgi:hypothetical protein
MLALPPRSYLADRREDGLRLLRFAADLSQDHAAVGEIRVLKPNVARCHSAYTERPAKICVTCQDETEK